MRYSKLVELYEKLNSTNSTLEMTDILAKFMENLDTEDIEKVALLVQGVVFPKTAGKDIGVASKTMVKAIARATGVSERQINKLWKETGDLGSSAEKAMKNKTQRKLGETELTVSRFVENLDKASKSEGSGSVDRKISLVSEIISSCTPVAAKYAVRTILGNMRLGVGDGTVRDAIAQVFDVKKKKIERAFHLIGDYGKVARILKEKGEKGLEYVRIEIGRPIKSMLFVKVETAEEGFERVGKPCICDVKYDGMRAQIHYDKNNVKIFTRRLDDVTKQFPDIVEAVKESVDVESCILDAEAVGYDKNMKNAIPFQRMSRRIKRKYDIEQMAAEMPTKTFVFDCLMYNSKSLFDTPFAERRKIVEKIVKKSKSMQPCPAIESSDINEVEKFFENAISQGHEGLMMKSKDAIYKPGKRVGYGVKLKPGVETFDLVVVEAIWGEGKRSRWLSSYVLACRDGEEFKTIGKMASGPTEEQYEEITEILKPLIVETSGKTVKVEPKLVLEVGYQEIQKSPTYESGFALRFPVLKNIRYDKPLSEVDDIKKIKEVYEKNG